MLTKPNTPTQAINLIAGVELTRTFTQEELHNKAAAYQAKGYQVQTEQLSAHRYRFTATRTH